MKGVQQVAYFDGEDREGVDMILISKTLSHILKDQRVLIVVNSGTAKEALEDKLETVLGEAPEMVTVIYTDPSEYVLTGVGAVLVEDYLHNPIEDMQRLIGQNPTIDFYLTRDCSTE